MTALQRQQEEWVGNDIGQSSVQYLNTNFTNPAISYTSASLGLTR